MMGMRGREGGGFGLWACLSWTDGRPSAERGPEKGPEKDGLGKKKQGGV